MTPRHLFWILAATIAAATAATAHAGELSFSSRIDQPGRITSCSDIEMRFWKDSHGRDDIITVRRSQTLSLGLDVKRPLKVEAPDRGGCRVQPSIDGSLSAIVCMAAGATSSGDGEKILDRLHVENDGGVLRVSGPDSDDWAAMIVLSVPDGSTLDLNATNGPLVLGDVDGHFTVRTTNGPIKLAHVGGVVDARADNGPVKFRGHAGDVTLVANNGPIDVELDAVEWSGKQLDASTQNGPLKLSVPDGMKSGVDVTGSAWSPTPLRGFRTSTHGSWRHPHSYHFGGDATKVRLSTVNGPVKFRGPVPSSGGVEI